MDAANNLDAAAGFFSPAANIKPYLKVAAQGFAGTGKTFTLAQIAKELILQRKKLDPSTPMRIAMIDTEKSSGFLRRIFDAAGIEFMVKETRSLADVVKAIDLCESGYAPALLLDSLSHIYENFVEAYKTERKRTRLEMLDWGVLKPKWKDTFSSRFVRSRVDILFTGRAGYEYDSNETTDERTGKKKFEIFKSGVKMKVDAETAYEPDIVLHMERTEELLEDDKVVYRTCTVLKDRSGLLDGKTLKNPTGAEFGPVFDYLLTNPAAVVADEPEGSDRSLFHDDDDTEKRKLRREILLEKIEETIREAAPGQSVAEKSFRQQLLKTCLGTLSWREVTVMDLERLQRGLDQVVVAIAEARGAKKQSDAEGKPFDPNTPEPAAPAARGKTITGNGIDKTVITEPITVGAKDGAEVSTVQPLSDVERERHRRGITQKLNARFETLAESMRWLTDETGRGIVATGELTDDELRSVLHKLNGMKAGV